MDLRDQLQSTLGGAYTLERELGGGGMSRVFVAEEKALGRKVAVKVLPPELTAGVNVERFNREILVAAKLQHPHIVPVLSAGEMDGLPYYTMPFVEGESLRVRLAKTNAISLTDAIGILRDVAKALAYAHERGIVHRDIKPDNVLITGGSATVTDFGIAKAISASRTMAPGGTLTQVGTSIGTPTYMSPEQAAGDPETDHRADIYSFGCLAYELLAGRPPFVEKSPRKLLAAHMGERPTPVSELRPDTPATLADMVMRCLEKDADARPQNASDLVRVLETVTSGGTHPAMPAVLLGGQGMLRKALTVYAVAFVAVAILAKAAITGIGLPDWVFPGSLIVMALGLPVILLTGYVQRVTRHAMTMTPTFTPGGTPSLSAKGTMATIAIKASPHVSWRRTAQGGAYTFGGFVLLIGVFMALRSLGIGPFGSLLASGRIGQKDPILLTDFRISNTDSALGRVVSDAVRQGLSESSVISLVSPASVAAALRRMQQPSSAKVDLETARQLSVREGIKAIIDGEVATVGAGYIVTIRLLTVDSLTPLWLHTATGEGSQGLIDAVDKATRALRAKVGESLRRVNASAPLQQVSTASLPALRKYSEAYRANAMDADYERAARLAREAAAMDSTFAMAWRLVATAMVNGNMSPAGVDTAYERAYALRDRLTERERAWMVGNYFENSVRHGERRKAIAAWESLLQIGNGPDSGVAYNSIGNLLRNRREWARADSVYLIGLRADSSQNFIYSNRVIVLIALGRLEEADKVARDAVRRFPSFFTAWTRLMEARYALGDLATVRRAADSLATNGNPLRKTWALGRKAEFALFDGKLTEWSDLRARSAAFDSARGVRSAPLVDAATTAIVESIIGDSSVRALAMNKLDDAVQRLPMKSIAEVERPYSAIASAYAVGGRADRAKAILARYTSEITDTALLRRQAPAYHNALGEVALAERRFGDAMKEFRDGDMLPDGPATACSTCLLMRLARAFDADGQRDSALAMYERYLATPYNQRYATLNDPTYRWLAHSRLGALYQQAGNSAKSAEHFAAWAEQWKGADAGLRARVANARSQAQR